MKLKSEEVAWAIEKEINGFEDQLSLESVGYILQLGDGIARVWGLDDAMMSEWLEFSNGTFGMVLNLELDSVGVVLLGPQEGLKEQDIVKRTGKVASIPVGPALLGRVVSPLGVPLDGKGPIETDQFRPLEGTSPNVVERQPVCEPLQTGIKAVDAMIPIGRGQRELIIGDRQTGKTTLIIDTIINQKDKDMICIYVAIGQKASTVSKLVALLEERGAMAYTTVVVATASDPAPLQYIAPYAAASMGEYYMYSGKHAVCFYDDLSMHAQAYRQLALLLRRPPGREAYPGDIFYLHSRLLERAAKLNDAKGGGSLTAIPVIETQANDVTTYIPTNVISITDGQIYLESDLFFSGVRPAVNVGISASRVGGKAQTKAMKKVAGSLRLDLAQFRELAAFTQFGSELDARTKAQLARGERMVEILKQDKFSPCSLEDEVISIFMGTEGYLDDLPLDQVLKFEKDFLAYVGKEYQAIPETISKTKNLEQSSIDLLKEAIEKFKEIFKNEHLARHPKAPEIS
ncbi:MAG: F0F1 ATP synthase subunit alpha [Parachlamydiaceae bacterium]|nr:F0F1 ATP synthase subunit alpha [Parachlamydiaceae bacterium]